MRCLCFIAAPALYAMFAMFAVSAAAEENSTSRMRIELEQLPAIAETKTAGQSLITTGNLELIQTFILARGERQTYCNMYNDNPASKVGQYEFFLNPDTGQENINCDPLKSGFHILVIRNSEGGAARYWTVRFLPQCAISIETTAITGTTTPDQLCRQVTDALSVILQECRREDVR